ncbi:MAG: hypothetical protein E3K32_13475 [wastewater metagenome]|nr:hypothetical protein [Candidatus Loosdrechtia aerotolerans]
MKNCIGNVSRGKSPFVLNMLNFVTSYLSFPAQKGMVWPRLLLPLLAVVVSLSISTPGFAQGNIVDYFLKDPNAWEDTRKITRKEPTMVTVTDGLEGLGLDLVELTRGDEVALIFLETRKSDRLKQKGFLRVEDKLVPGKNRVVSVITRNSGDRTKFHYKFILQRNINNEPVTIYNNGNAVLESIYDGSQPVKDISNLSGIKLCEIEVR